MPGRATWILGVLSLAAVVVACGGQRDSTNGRPPDQRILRLEEMSYPEIDALDREGSIIFITFGNLEEHGPHLPVGTDSYQAVGLRDRIIDRLRVSHPDRTFVLMPVIPLGEGGFNDVARQFDHIGTTAVRDSTLRDVAVDIGSSFARQGFRNIFLIHFHGPPPHNRALSDACAYVSEKYGVRMVNITSLMFAGGIFSATVLGRHLPDGWEEDLGLDLHGGPAETSTILYLRGDLVKPEYRDLPAFPLKDFEELGRAYMREGFQGYANHPALASRELGEDLVNDAADRAAAIARRALDGEDLSSLPAWPDLLPASEGFEETLRLIEQRYEEQSADLEAWLEERR